MVCRSAYLSVYRNCWTDRDAVWVVDSCWPKEARVTRGYIGATWRIRLNRSCTCTCWSYEAELYELSISAMWSSKRFLKLLTKGAATTWFGNEFHKLTVLCEKKYFLMLSRHDFLCNFSWCPRSFNSREAFPPVCITNEEVHRRMSHQTVAEKNIYPVSLR